MLILNTNRFPFHFHTFQLLLIVNCTYIVLRNILIPACLPTTTFTVRWFLIVICVYNIHNACSKYINEMLTPEQV